MPVGFFFYPQCLLLPYWALPYDGPDAKPVECYCGMHERQFPHDHAHDTVPGHGYWHGYDIVHDHELVNVDCHDHDDNDADADADDDDGSVS